jgi:hypothetical protein
VTPTDLLGRGKLRRVERHWERRALVRSLRAKEKGGPETWRTPWPDAGCNKPAGCRVEQTAEVGKNGKGGTRPERGSSGPKGGPRPTREWTRDICTGGGAIFDEPQERSPERGRQDLRARSDAGRTARTDKRLCRRGRVFNSIQNLRRRRHRGEGQPPAMLKASMTTRCDFGCGCEIVVEPAKPTSREAVGPREGHDLTVRCAKL